MTNKLIFVLAILGSQTIPNYPFDLKWREMVFIKNVLDENCMV